MFRAMKYLLLLAVLFAACAPKPVKVYSEVEIGMSDLDFYRICGDVPDDSQTTTNTSGSIKVLFNGPTDRINRVERPYQCTGRFTFVNRKLDTISR